MSASDEDSRLLSVAESISEGTPVNWKDVDEQTGPLDVPIIRELKALEGLARSHEETPKSWGPFTIIGELARGAFGTVYIATEPELQRDIALKVIRPRNPELPIDPDTVFKEARLLAKIVHPNVVRVFRAERIGNEVGFAMELVTGRTLDDLVQTQSPFNANEATLIGLDLCRALAAVHRSGALHGDIKAHNVMRGEGGRTVLMDFGAGKDVNVTHRHLGNDFAGTPLYMAPEIFAGHQRSKASDLYSLGVLLYYLVSGSYPVPGDSRTEVERRHNQLGERRLLRDARPDLPDEFVGVVEKALAERPNDRYRSAGEFEAALAQTLSRRPEPVPPRISWKPILIAASVIIAITVGITIYRLPGQAGPSTSSQIASSLPATSADEVGTYRITAAFNREQDGADVPIQAGMRLAPADKLSLDITLSQPAFVYVIEEDEHGESNLLFPLPGLTLTNPLPAGHHQLPGTYEKEKLYWQVTTAGGREHFVIMASPTRSMLFEKMFAALPKAAMNKPVQFARLSTKDLGVLRSVGGLAVATSPDAQLRLTPAFETPLSGREETARGLWIRQATFENPE